MLKKLAIIFSVTLFLSYCTNLNDGPTQPTQDIPSGNITLNLDMQTAPQEIAAVKGFLARADYDTIFFEFDIKGDSAVAQVENLQPGEWYLQVDAYDENGNRKYSGSDYVVVEAGKITPVFLNLDQVTGGITITVSWGGVPKNMMIVMAKNSLGEWRILLIKDKSYKIFDLIDGRYPIWINEQHDKFMFLRNTNELCEFDLSSHKVKTINSFSKNVNFLFYSQSLNRILFDYLENGYWNLGYVNTYGEDFHIILSDSNKEKYPITPKSSNWIYYHVIKDNLFQIYRIKYDGSQNEKFIHSEMHCGYPAFSKNGEKMVYTKFSLDSTHFQVIVRDMKTGEETSIDVSEIGQPIYPTFDNSGEYIYLPIIIGPNIWDRPLFRIKIDGSEITQLTYTNRYNYFTRPRFW